MFEALVVDSLSEFLEKQPIPEDISITTFSSTHIPPTTCRGIIPDVTTRVDEAVLDRLPDLHIIANYGVGYDNIDIAAAKARGISVTNTPGVLTEATADLTWALILATARRLGEGERMVRGGEWAGWQPTQLRGLALQGRRLGILGAGRIGRAVGARARAFGMRVSYWSRSRQRDWELEFNTLFAELDEVVRTSDILSIHLAKSPETNGLVDPRKLKDRAILINTARGAVVDEAALIRELQSGRISAGLDVYVDEPRVADGLIALDNVVLLPHIGSATYEARQAMWDLAWANLLAGLRGDGLLNPV